MVRLCLSTLLLVLGCSKQGEFSALLLRHAIFRQCHAELLIFGMYTDSGKI